MSVKERLKKFIKSEDLTATDFEKSIDAGNSYVNNISRSIGLDKLEVISKLYPRLNIEWLLVGVGEMYKTAVQTEIRGPASLAGENLPAYGVHSRKIPIYDISVAAGVSGLINSNEEIIDYISLPVNMIGRGSNYVGVRARGESMSPTIYDSSIIIARELNRSEWLDMPDEHVYVIVSRDDSYLKRVKNRLEKNFIVCMSDNLDKYNFPSFNLQADEINFIYHAEFLISAKMPNINQTYYSRLKQLEDRFDSIEEFVKKIK